MLFYYFKTGDYIIENDIKYNFLIFYIYDILTSLSICKSKTQVIALDIQSNFKKKEINLTFTEN